MKNSPSRIVILLVWAAVLVILLIAGSEPVSGQASKQVQSVGTLGDLKARRPVVREVIEVRNGSSTNLWAAPRTFVHDPDATDAADDVYVVTNAAASGRYTATDRSTGIIDPRHFGAIGDGVTDDTAAMLAAFTSIQARGTIYVPKGIYSITSTLYVTNNAVTIRGDGPDSSTIWMRSNGPAMYVGFPGFDGGISDYSRHQFVLEDFGVRGVDGVTNQVGIQVSAASRVALNRVFAETFGDEHEKGFFFDRWSWWISVQNCKTYNCWIGLLASGNTTNVNIPENSFNAADFSGNTFRSGRYGMILGDPLYSTNTPLLPTAYAVGIRNSSFENFGELGVWIASPWNCIVDNNYIENNPIGVRIGATNWTSRVYDQAKNVSVKNNHIYTLTNSASAGLVLQDEKTCVQIQGGLFATIKENHFMGYKRAAVEIQSTGVKQTAIDGNGYYNYAEIPRVIGPFAGVAGNSFYHRWIGESWIGSGTNGPDELINNIVIDGSTNLFRAQVVLTNKPLQFAHGASDWKLSKFLDENRGLFHGGFSVSNGGINLLSTNGAGYALAYKRDYDPAQRTVIPQDGTLRFSDGTFDPDVGMGYAGATGWLRMWTNIQGYGHVSVGPYPSIWSGYAKYGDRGIYHTSTDTSARPEVLIGYQDGTTNQRVGIAVSNRIGIVSALASLGGSEIRFMVDDQHAATVTNAGVVIPSGKSINMGGDTIDDFTGTGLSVVGRKLTLAAGSGLPCVINVGDYGAAGDGVTDDTASLQSAFNAAVSGCVIVFEEGKTYRIATSVDILRSDITVEFNGATILPADNAVQRTTLRFGKITTQAGVINGDPSLAAAVSSNSTTVTVSLPTAYPGSMIQLWSATTIAGGDYNIGQLAFVAANTGTSIVLDRLPWTNFTAESAWVYSAVTNVTVRNGSFNLSSSYRSTPLAVYGRQSTVESCRFYDTRGTNSTGYSGIDFLGEDLTAKNNHASYILDNSGGAGRSGYGIFLSGYNVRAVDNVIDSCKHGIATSQRKSKSFGLVASGNRITQDISLANVYSLTGDRIFVSALDGHANIAGYLVENNYLTFGRYGIGVRCGDATIRGNRLEMLGDISDGLIHFHLAFSEAANRNLLVENNVFNGPSTQRLIWWDAAETDLAENITFKDNLIYNGRLEFTGTADSGSQYQWSNVVVSGNAFRGDGPSVAVYDTASAFRIMNNYMAYTTNGIFWRVTNSYAGNLIKDNIFSPLAGGNDIAMSASNTIWPSIEGNAFSASGLSRATNRLDFVTGTAFPKASLGTDGLRFGSGSAYPTLWMGYNSALEIGFANANYLQFTGDAGNFGGVLYHKIAGDSINRMELSTDGITFGPGSSARDSGIRRTASQTLTLSNNIVVPGSITIGGDTIDDFTGTGLSVVGGKLTATGGGGLGTNAFVNNVLVQPLKLTNSAAITGGIVWITNAAGDVLAYATNFPAGTGDVVGPASTTTNNIAVFADATGKVIADGGVTVASLATEAEVAAGYEPLNSNKYQSTNATLTAASTSGSTGTGAFVRADSPTLTGTWAFDLFTANTITVLSNLYAVSVAYGAGWNGSSNVPTRDAVYDEMELRAPLLSPAFTGSPTVPTAAAGTSNTVAASTKYVDDALYSKIQPFDSLNRYIERVWSFDSGVTAAALEPGLQGAAITSGTLAARAGTLGYPGGVDFKTAATDVLNTGYYLYTGTAVILFTNELFFKWTGTINRTNGAIARIGFGDQLGTTAFTDGAYFAITNNQLIGVCRTSSSETVTPTATAYVVPQSTPISLYMAATNATVSFQAFEGSTLVWSDTLSAMPLGRDFGVAIQGWNGLAANTNAVSIMSNLRAGYRASVQ